MKSMYFALALLATSTTMASDATPTDTLVFSSTSAVDSVSTSARGGLVRERPAFTAFEFDVFTKERMGTDPRRVHAITWKKAMSVCDDADGYLMEYHDGYKQTFPDTREGAARMYAYGTCKVSQRAGELSIATHPDAIVRLEADDLTTANGRVTATGHLSKAYEAARSKVYDSCAVLDRRVRFMSFVYGTTWDGKDQVQVRFACNSAMNASAFGD